MKHTPRQPIHCGHCTACCRDHTLVVLDAGEDPSTYETIEGPLNSRALAHRDNGDCVYLDPERGCTIYDRRPKMCQVFDCRGLLAGKSRNERRQLLKRQILTRAVVQAGLERMGTW